MTEQTDLSLGTIPRSYAVKRVRRLAVWFLMLQGSGVIAWWAVLLLFPSTRELFMAPSAPGSTLLAFIVGDLALYAGGSFLAAYGLGRGRPWAWAALCANAGTTVYAALYGLTLPLFSGGGWLGALLMAPSFVVLPVLVWLLRPERLS